MSLEFRYVPLSELQPYHKNPRRGNVKAIAESLKKRGQYKPLTVNVGTLTGRPMEILAGNHTFHAATSLELPTVAIVTVDVDDAEAAQIVLADNRLADLGTYDDGDLLATIQDAGDLTGTGYTDQDLTALLRALDEPQGLTDPDDVPDLPDADTITVEGDVWRLGPHVLYVGSSGNIDAVLDAAPASADALAAISTTGPRGKHTLDADAAATSTGPAEPTPDSEVPGPQHHNISATPPDRKDETP